MNAMTEPVHFALPKKPRVYLKEPMPDQRKVSVIPIRALTDPRLTDGVVRILALLCSYCNRAGLTWVSQKRLSEDMKTTRQNITGQLAKLREAGYVEIVRKGFRGERTNTLRVIFDPTISAEEAIAITSNKEDTRPPSMQDTLDKAGQERINSMIAKALKAPTKQQEKTMPKSGQTRTVREMKEAIAKAQAKQTKPVDKDGYIGNPPVAYEDVLKVPQEELENDSRMLHRQPIGNPGVSLKAEEHIKEEADMSSMRNKLIEEGLSAKQIEDSLEILLPLYRAEGITPSSHVLMAGIRQLVADTR